MERLAGEQVRGDVTGEFEDFGNAWLAPGKLDGEEEHAGVEPVVHGHPCRRDWREALQPGTEIGAAPGQAVKGERQAADASGWQRLTEGEVKERKDRDGEVDALDGARWHWWLPFLPWRQDRTTQTPAQPTGRRGFASKGLCRGIPS